MEKEKRDVLYLVQLKNGLRVSMTLDQIEADRDLIEPADVSLAPKYQAIIDKKKSFRGKNEQKPGEE